MQISIAISFPMYVQLLLLLDRINYEDIYSIFIAFFFIFLKILDCISQLKTILRIHPKPYVVLTLFCIQSEDCRYGIPRPLTVMFEAGGTPRI